MSSRVLSANAVIALNSNSYTATCTNSCGAQSSVTLTINVDNPSPKPKIRENLALNKVVYADDYILGENPENAVDGTVDDNSKWCVNSGDSSSHWFAVDLGDVYELDTFVIQHAGAGGESRSWNTSDYIISTSLYGTDWTIVADISGNPKSVTRDVSNPVKGRYVKLDIIDPSNDNNTAVRIYEFEVYGPFNSHCLTGDTAGASGIPDCTVNMYDFRAIADSWLTCQQSDDTQCLDYTDMEELNFVIGSWVNCLGNGCQ